MDNPSQKTQTSCTATKIPAAEETKPKRQHNASDMDTASDKKPGKASKIPRLIDKGHLAKPDLSALDEFANCEHQLNRQKLPSLSPKALRVKTASNSSTSPHLVSPHIHPVVKSRLETTAQENRTQGENRQSVDTPKKLSHTTTKTQSSSARVTPQQVIVETVSASSSLPQESDNSNSLAKNKRETLIKPDLSVLETRLPSNRPCELRALASNVLTTAIVNSLENQNQLHQDYYCQRNVVVSDSNNWDGVKNKMSTTSEGPHLVHVQPGILDGAGDAGSEKRTQEIPKINIPHKTTNSIDQKDKCPNVAEQSHLERKPDPTEKIKTDRKKCHHNRRQDNDTCIDNTNLSERNALGVKQVTKWDTKLLSSNSHTQNQMTIDYAGDTTSLDKYNEPNFACQHQYGVLTIDQSDNTHVMGEVRLAKNVNNQTVRKQQEQSGLTNDKSGGDVNVDKQTTNGVFDIGLSVNKRYSVPNTINKDSNECASTSTASISKSTRGVNNPSSIGTSYHRSDEKLFSCGDTTDSDTGSLYKKSSENLLLVSSYFGSTGSDAYLLDELLTDSIISEDGLESGSNLDLKNIQEHILENKATDDLSTKTDVVDNKKAVGKSEPKGTSSAPSTSVLAEANCDKNNVVSIDNSKMLESTLPASAVDPDSKDKNRSALRNSEKSDKDHSSAGVERNKQSGSYTAAAKTDNVGKTSSNNNNNSKQVKNSSKNVQQANCAVNVVHNQMMITATEGNMDHNSNQVVLTAGSYSSNSGVTVAAGVSSVMDKTAAGLNETEGNGRDSDKTGEMSINNRNHNDNVRIKRNKQRSDKLPPSGEQARHHRRNGAGNHSGRSRNHQQHSRHSHERSNPRDCCGGYSPGKDEVLTFLIIFGDGLMYSYCMPKVIRVLYW